VAALLFLLGLYAIVSDSWPESFGAGIIETVIVIVSLYYTFAGAIIMLSLGCKRKKHPIFALMGEMYGWMFVACASLATVLVYIGSLISSRPDNWSIWLIMVSIWLGLAISSGVRFLDLFQFYRSIKRNG
jgi:amino acid transporter